MINNIETFLEERKTLWLKERLKKAATDEDAAVLQQQANDKYSPQEWLTDAAKRVTQLCMVSHPSKFSHPSAKTSSVIANPNKSVDGYFRSGNIDYPLDVFGNAAAMDVFKFLSINDDQGNTVLSAFEKKDPDLNKYLSKSELDIEVLAEAFLKIKAIDATAKTDHLVKQVYFPIGGQDYHLLSSLTASGLMTKLKQRIDQMRFSEETKAAKLKRKNNEHDETGFEDIYQLTVTAYGGTQPQNVSVLNSQNAGRAYLLSSAPPQLEKRALRLPKSDFFVQCLFRNNFQDSFIQLHRLMQLNINNANIRRGIQNIIEHCIDQILLQAFKIRQYYPAGWSNEEYYANLPKIQRIWLDEIYQVQRADNTEWRDALSADIARWVIKSYETSIKHSNMLGAGEMTEVQKWVEDSMLKAKGYF